MNDKWQHGLVCYAIVLTGRILFGLWYGVLLAFMFALGKELYDAIRKDGTGWSWDDINADMLGILLGIVVSIGGA